MLGWVIYGDLVIRESLVLLHRAAGKDLGLGLA